MNQWKHHTCILGLVCLSFFLCEGAFASLDSSWSQAVDSLRRQDYSAAISQFEDWQKQAAGAGIHSPQAALNLASAYWESRQAGDAIYTLLASERYQLSPLRVSRDLNYVEAMEKEIGVKESLAEDLSFRFAFLLSPNWLVLLFSLGFWCLAVRYVVRPKASHLRAMLLSVGFASCAVALLLLADIYYCGNVAVLTNEGEPVSLYKSPLESPEQKLIELPSGAIVTIDGEHNDYLHIEQPLAAWIVRSDAKILPTFNGSMPALPRL